MKLEAVKIENYKALREVSVDDLTPLAALWARMVLASRRCLTLWFSCMIACPEALRRLPRCAADFEKLCPGDRAVRLPSR